MKTATIIILQGLICAAALAPALARAAWLEGFACRRQIEVDCSKIDAPLTNFPALMRLTTNNFDFAKARPDGFDVRFAAAGGVALLAHERERHDAAAEAAEYWVKLPLVAADSNTVFYMYYGCPSAADDADAAKVWDDNHKMVLHLHETTGTHYDSTSNGNNGTPQNGINQNVSGKINGADDWDGANDYVEVSNSASLDFGDTGSYSIEFWIFKKSPYKDYDEVWSKGVTGNQRIHFLVNSGGVLFRWSDFPGPVVPLNQWTHICYAFSSAGVNTGTEIFYLNGNETHSRTGGMPAWSAANDYRLGYHSYMGGSWPVNGLIDEFRISDIPRSTAWIKSEYHSGNGDLTIYGDEQRQSGFFNPEFF